MLTTKLLPKNQQQLASQKENQGKAQDYKGSSVGSTQKSIGLCGPLLTDTVTFIPCLNGPSLNEKIKTCNLCTDGILVVIAVEGLKEFQESISKCYAH